jgi:hypothetical protein
MTARRTGAPRYRRATEAIVLDVRRRYWREGEAVTSIAQALGLGETGVRRMAVGVTWGNVPQVDVASRVPRRRRVLRGADHPNAKLSADSVLYLRARHRAGDDLGVLAHELRVSTWCVGLIVRGERWQHLLPGAEAEPQPADPVRAA